MNLLMEFVGGDLPLLEMPGTFLAKIVTTPSLVKAWPWPLADDNFICSSDELDIHDRFQAEIFQVPLEVSSIFTASSSNIPSISDEHPLSVLD